MIAGGAMTKFLTLLDEREAKLSNWLLKSKNTLMLAELSWQRVRKPFEEGKKYSSQQDNHVQLNNMHELFKSTMKEDFCITRAID